MSESPKTATTVATDKRFKDMDGGEKAVFIGKSIIFILSGGFIFPTIWSD